MKTDKLITKRFSPYSFNKNELKSMEIKTLFDAARRASSSYNEQPWKFIFAVRQNKSAFKTILQMLLDVNSHWAQDASMIVLTFTKKTFSKNENPYFHSMHDLGLAMGNFTIQATSMGLSIHHMAGIHYDKIRSTYKIPEDYHVMTAVAVGYTYEKHNKKERKSIEEITSIGLFKSNFEF